MHEAYLKLMIRAPRGVAKPRAVLRGRVADDAAHPQLIARGRMRMAKPIRSMRARVTLDEGARATLAGQPRTCSISMLALTRLAAFDSRSVSSPSSGSLAACPLEEAGEALGISMATAERDWQAARAWLLKELGARR